VISKLTSYLAPENQSGSISHRGLRVAAGLVVILLTLLFNLYVVGREDLANVTMVYLIAIAGVSIYLGYQPAIAATVTCALTFDYFFLTPYHSLRIATGRDLLTFIGMFAIAICTSLLHERLRLDARKARENESRMEALYALAKALVDATSSEEVCLRSATQIEQVGAATACILVREKETFRRAYNARGQVALETEDLALANWVATRLEAAGVGTENATAATACYLPLLASRGCVGVLSLRPRTQDAEGTGFTESLSILLSMARQVALALDRALLAQEKQGALIEAETERIRSAVLSSVSHDLRAPLAVIGSASSTLVENGLRLPDAARSEMAKIIFDEARRLNELLRSLLDVTRLQSGGLIVSREWESLEEIVGSVLRHIEEHGPGRVLRVHIPSALPLLQLDAVLIEQALLNLADNAFKHSHSEPAVEIDLAIHDKQIIVYVIDHGQGVHDGELASIFDKFYRGESTSGTGLGLGLTIARGIVEAHGGRMWASHTAGGGLTVQFSLPIGDAPPQLGSTDLIEPLAAGGRG